MFLVRKYAQRQKRCDIVKYQIFKMFISKSVDTDLGKVPKT